MERQKHSFVSILFYSLVFLVFFQLISDFIEAIYTFGLLSVDIPPEVVSVVLFFSPFLLLLFRRNFSRGALLALAGGAALMRFAEVMLTAGPKLVACGLGVGLILLYLPAALAGYGQDGQRIEAGTTALEIGAGLAIALALSIFLRSLGAGSDPTLVFPLFSWILAAVFLLALLLVDRRPQASPAPLEPQKNTFGGVLALSLGTFSSLALIYFAFLSPTVLSRWSGASYPGLLITLSIGLLAYFVALAFAKIGRLSHGLVLAWNAVFILAGVGAILGLQVAFPANSAAFPLYQNPASAGALVLLFLMVLLSPIVLLDFTFFALALARRRPSPRQVGGAFGLAALFFLIFVLAQVFTTVYDYIPVVGPWFRDRFWLAFLLPCLGMALPLLAGRLSLPFAGLPVLKAIYLPALAALLVFSVAWVTLSAPRSVTPGDAATLRVMTYNIQQGYSADGRRNYAGQLDVIRTQDPDILGLEESDVARFSGGNADIVRTFADGLNMYAYYGPRTVTGTFGIALLSKYPIENPRTFYMYSSGEQTAAILAQVTVGTKKYHILVTHLGNDGPMIQQQQVLQESQGLDNLIAMGDFNFSLDTDQYRLTRQSLDDAWALAGSPDAPGLDLNDLIDHIFVSPGTTVQSAGYLVSPNSDHPALVAVLAP